MQKVSPWINYEERLNRVTTYIYDHLDEALDLIQLAEIAYLSPYHFHRIYRAARGETIFTTVQRLRLYRAASYLAQTNMSISEISKKSGYKNVQSFTRTFNEIYAMPPARYRKHGSHAQYKTQHSQRSIAMYEVTIKVLPDIEVISVNHNGTYLQIGQAFAYLGNWLGTRQLIDANSRMMGIYYDDPAIVAEKDLRSRACFTVNQPFAPEAPLERITIACGEYAVLRHQGPYADLQAAYNWLFGTWLLQSGRELGDRPVFEEYLNTPMDTAPAELLTDIHLPLK